MAISAVGLAVSLLLPAAVSGHMGMRGQYKDPMYNGALVDDRPLADADGAARNSLCGLKSLDGLLDSQPSFNFTAGQVYNINFDNAASSKAAEQGHHLTIGEKKEITQARHEGGICFFAMSCDEGASFWITGIYTTTCPDLVYDWPTRIPDTTPPGRCIFSFIWKARGANQGQGYHKCAMADVSAPESNTLEGFHSSLCPAEFFDVAGLTRHEFQNSGGDTNLVPGDGKEGYGDGPIPEQRERNKAGEVPRCGPNERLDVLALCTEEPKGMVWRAMPADGPVATMQGGQSDSGTTGDAQVGSAITSDDDEGESAASIDTTSSEESRGPEQEDLVEGEVEPPAPEAGDAESSDPEGRGNEVTDDYGTVGDDFDDEACMYYDEDAGVEPASAGPTGEDMLVDDQMGAVGNGSYPVAGEAGSAPAGESIEEDEDEACAYYDEDAGVEPASAGPTGEDMLVDDQMGAVGNGSYPVAGEAGSAPAGESIEGEEEEEEEEECSY